MMNLRACAALLIVGLVVPLEAQVRQVRLTGSPPPPVQNIGAVVVGTPGAAKNCYWVVVNYVGGAIVSPKAACLQTIPGTLSMSNSVTVTWQAAAGAVSYDVLKTANPSNGPVPGTSTALATGLTTTSTSDQGGSLSSYTPTAFPYLNPSTTLVINNRDYNPPQIQFVNNNFLFTLGNLTTPFPIDTSGAAETVLYSVSANPTIAQVNAGFTLLASNSLRTLKVQAVYLQALGGTAAACTDVRISDTANVDAATAAVALLVQNTVLDATTVTSIGTFAPTALTPGAGLQIRKTGSACTTATTIRAIVFYTINS
jgi:hypothetical protein